MADFTDLITQAKKMQEKMKDTQEALKKIEVEGISGGDAIRIIMNGDGELKKISFVSLNKASSKVIFFNSPSPFMITLTALPPDIPSTSIFFRAS